MAGRLPGDAGQHLPDRGETATVVASVPTSRRRFRLGYYLAKVYNTTGSYWEETQATITNDGSKVIWAANWDQEVGTERCWVMQVEVPSEFRPAPLRGAGHEAR